MAVVTKTIGSGGGRDYSSLTAWMGGLPANIVTSGNSYVASMYNDSEIVDTAGGSTPNLNLTGFTTDATHNLTITAAAGQAWCDSTSNAGGYVAANGVAIRRTDHRSTVIECDVNFTTISRLQLSGGHVAINASAESLTITNCVLEVFLSTGVINVNGGNATIANNFIIVNNASNSTFGIGIGHNGSNGPAIVVYNTIVRVSDYSAGDPIVGNHYGWSGTFTNNACFGFTSTYDASGMTGTNNGTDQSSVTGSTSNQVSLTYTSQFTTTTNTGQDFRLKTGNSLAGNGITYGGISVDAYGTTRGSPPAIGAHEPASPSLSGSITESGSAADSTGAAATFAGSVAESGTAATATDSIRNQAGSVAESLSGADSGNATATFASSTAESASSTDAVSVAASTWVGATAEAGTASDSTDVTTSTYVGAANETLASTDATSVAAIFASSITESGSISDSSATNAIFACSITETASAADTADGTRILAGASNVAETATATDSTNATAQFVAALSEALTASDSPDCAAIYPCSITETLTTSDTPAASTVFTCSVSESLTAADAANAARIVSTAVSEAAAAADTTLCTAVFPVSVSETGILADHVQAPAIYIVSVSEALSVSTIVGADGTIVIVYGVQHANRLRALAAKGRTMTLRRLTSTSTSTDISLLGYMTRYNPLDVTTGSITQGDALIAIMNDEIIEAAWPGPPRPRDQMVIDSRVWVVRGVDAVFEGPTCIGHNIAVRGG